MPPARLQLLCKKAAMSFVCFKHRKPADHQFPVTLPLAKFHTLRQYKPASAPSLAFLKSDQSVVGLNSFQRSNEWL